jgi:hypothetical protein
MFFGTYFIIILIIFNIPVLIANNENIFLSSSTFSEFFILLHSSKIYQQLHTLQRKAAVV